MYSKTIIGLAAPLALINNPLSLQGKTKFILPQVIPNNLTSPFPKLLFILAFTTIFPFSSSIGQKKTKIVTGAEQIATYLNQLTDKRVALVVNNTSTIGNVHLVDTLKRLNVNVVKIFAPEHGFRGNVDAGEKVKDTLDRKTGIPVISLYGKNKKPKPEQLEDTDILLFDMQDVGVRFYTYISTLHYILEAAAESKKKVIVLDRPNPNGMYVEGPVLDLKFKSFVGMHPIPILYGLTNGELAILINKEGWLSNGIQSDLTVVNLRNYTHKSTYELPIKPSPNLPNALSISLYPSLCLFEGTKISVGRGTEFPFQVAGYPDSTFGSFQFLPRSIPGMSKNPMHEGETCYGIDLRNEKKVGGFSLQYLLYFYERWPDKKTYFNSFINNLSGTDQLRIMIESGKSAKEIEAGWQPKLEEYKKLRKKYLLYPD